MMAKGDKMEDKQIIAKDDTSFYLNWPNFSEAANKVVNVSFPLI